MKTFYEQKKNWKKVALKEGKPIKFQQNYMKTLVSDLEVKGGKDCN